MQEQYLMFPPGAFINWMLYAKASKSKQRMMRMQAIARHKLSRHPTFRINITVWESASPLKRRALLLTALHRSKCRRKHMAALRQPVDRLPSVPLDWMALSHLVNYLCGHSLSPYDQVPACEPVRRRAFILARQST